MVKRADGGFQTSISMHWFAGAERDRDFEPWLNGRRVRFAIEASDTAGWVCRLQVDATGQITSSGGKALTVVEYGDVELKPISSG